MTTQTYGRPSFRSSSSSSFLLPSVGDGSSDANSGHATPETPPNDSQGGPTDAAAVPKDTQKYFEYPDKTFPPTFNRRQVSAIGISHTIGSGKELQEAGPLGVLLGYAGMSFLIYCIIVSYTEMVSAYPSCQGTIALSNRFVDPALGFAMGWNAWAYWGITILVHITAAISLIRYFDQTMRLEPLWSSIVIIFSTTIVLFSRYYGNVETAFASVKVFGVLLLIVMGIILNVVNGFPVFTHHSPWKSPFAQFDSIEDARGRVLSLMTAFLDALVAAYLAAEVKDAPRVIAPLVKRTWMRVSILYFATVLVAGSLPAYSPDTCEPVSSSTKPDVDPWYEDATTDRSWLMSSIWSELWCRGSGYRIAGHFLIVCFLVSAMSAAAIDFFMSTRILYFLAQAGHAPWWLGLTFRRLQPGKLYGRPVPWVGLIISIGFGALSFFYMPPFVGNQAASVVKQTGSPSGFIIESKEEIFLSHIMGLNQSAYLQAIIGTLFTYIRFYFGTRYHETRGNYKQSIKRIKENRAIGQPYLAMIALGLCSFILLSRGWACFRIPGGGRWQIFANPNDPQAPNWQTSTQGNQFLVTYLPPPLLLLLIFGYKLVKRTHLVPYEEMKFGDVVKLEGNLAERVENKPPKEDLGDTSAPTAANIPKSFVVKHGEMGTSLTQLVRDVRKVMEPNTATRLKERSNNRLKDYIVMAPALKVSHLIAFSLTDLAPSLRIARLPQGPTFSFRVERYSLVKDVLHASRRPRSMNLEYLSAPLLVLASFPTGPETPAHLSLVLKCFQSLFPPLAPKSINLSSARRVVLISWNAETKTIAWRHYLISVRTQGVTNRVRRIVEGISKAPSGNVVNLSKEKDLADYVLKQHEEGYETGSTSAASDADPEESAVRLAANYPGRNNKKGDKRAVRLSEVGPRMELRLVKITEGPPGKEGSVLYHEFIHKDQKQTAELKEAAAAREKLRKERREEQERNIARKQKKPKRTKTGDGEGAEENEDGEEGENDDIEDDNLEAGNYDGWDEDAEMSDGLADAEDEASEIEESEDERPRKRWKTSSDKPKGSIRLRG
ncbi:hypothetical protein FRB96_000276 [Tulasnella sp. 330]|nr:hypothetical protein FRB96_000276 [Tulasnella sp. 330]